MVGDAWGIAILISSSIRTSSWHYPCLSYFEKLSVDLTRLWVHFFSGLRDSWSGKEPVLHSLEWVYLIFPLRFFFALLEIRNLRNQSTFDLSTDLKASFRVMSRSAFEDFFGCLRNKSKENERNPAAKILGKWPVLHDEDHSKESSLSKNPNQIDSSSSRQGIYGMSKCSETSFWWQARVNVNEKVWPWEDVDGKMVVIEAQVQQIIRCQ